MSSPKGLITHEISRLKSASGAARGIPAAPRGRGKEHSRPEGQMSEPETGRTLPPQCV